MPDANKRLCFVIMPFSRTASASEQEWTDFFDIVLKNAVEKARLNIDCRRSSASSGSVIQRIVNDLDAADVVVADLTDRNPNVMYELGVRHTLRRRTILIARNLDDVPSDLRGYGVLVYTTTPAGVRSFTKQVREELRSALADPARSDNPVGDYLTVRNEAVESLSATLEVRQMKALIAESRHAVLLVSHSGSTAIEGRVLRFPPLRLPAIDHLLATGSVDSNTLHSNARALTTLLDTHRDLRRDIQRNQPKKDCEDWATNMLAIVYVLLQFQADLARLQMPSKKEKPPTASRSVHFHSRRR